MKADGTCLPSAAKDFDARLIETSAVVQGIMEAHADCKPADDPGSGAASASGSGTGSSGSADGSASIALVVDQGLDPGAQSSHDFLEAMEEDVRAFDAFMQQWDDASAALHEAEAKYALDLALDAQKIAQTFGDKFSPMIPFKADYKQMLANLQKVVEDRLAEVAGFCGRAVEDVLRVVRR